MHRYLLVLAACGAAPHPDPLAPAIDALARDAAGHVAGLSIAVARGDTMFVRGYGLADDTHPVTASSVFRIGSITKQFTAAAILQLASAHRLALDDELQRYVAFPGPPVTLRQLLANTSGIHDYTESAWIAAHMAEHRPRGELLAVIGSAPRDFAPGTEWRYSSSGYYLLGLVIERVSGERWSDYIERRLLAPAGITGIHTCRDEQDGREDAHGYASPGVAAQPLAIDNAYAAGALCATAPALIAWARALAHGTIVAPDAWRAMTTPAELAGGGRFDYGLGLYLAQLGPHRMMFHGGAVNGFAAALAVVPDAELYIAVLANTEGTTADALGEAIARTELGVPKPRAASAVDEAAVVGRYRADTLGIVFVVERRGAQLVAHEEGKPARVLVRQRDGSYLIPERDARLEFVQTGGAVTGFRYTVSGLTIEGRRIPGA